MKLRTLILSIGGAAFFAGGTAQAITEPITTNFITGGLTGVSNWTANTVYVLDGPVYVLSNAVLNIEAGTVIKARDLSTNNIASDISALYVTRGGKIFANGTASRPIIMTTIKDDTDDPFDLGIYDRGLWGGLVVFGDARLNTASLADGNAASPKFDVYEGLSTNTVVGGQRVFIFGGNNDDDSSGVIRYVSIRHGGRKLETNKELNGCSLCGVGRGTTIEFVEAYATADDGFEFFGGTVNTKHLVSAFNDDDSFDTDQGHSGKHQFWFSIQESGVRDKGHELNGEPETLGVGNLPLARFEVYNETSIGAGANSPASGNNAFTIRTFASPNFFNCIFTDFEGRGATIDLTCVTNLDNGTLDFRDNIWWGFKGGTDPNSITNICVSNAFQVFFTDAARNNTITDPQLRNISRLSTGLLDPRPLPGSPATSSARTAPNDGFYSPVSYKGAFDTNDLWISGWTAISQYEILKQRGTNFINISGGITGVSNWTRENTYVLNGPVYVLSNAVLNIEAGTVIKGRDLSTNNTASDISALYVTRGGKIFANGTANSPIIMTAFANQFVDDPLDLGLYDRGLWGGLVVFGDARLNTASLADGNAASPKFDVYEGLSTNTVVNGQRVFIFGGNNDDDSSGVIRYVSIRHGGRKLETNKELNGCSFCGVGRGTTIEFVEAYATADDGFEFFGGTVNTRYLVSAFNDDDSFDTDQGHSGKHQFWFGIQESGVRDKGHELNGEPETLGVGNLPLARFEVYNETSIGAGTNTGGSGNNAFTIRTFASPRFFNSIFTDYGQRGATIDLTAITNLDNGDLDFRDNIWWAFTGGTDPNSITNICVSNAFQIFFTDATRNNTIIDPQITKIGRLVGSHLDPRPLPGSPAFTSTRTAPENGFYTPVDYKGAFSSNNWAADWTAIGFRGIMSGAGAAAPRDEVLMSIVPNLTGVVASSGSMDGTTFTLTFETLPGWNYQAQCSTNLQEGGGYTNFGPLISGSGTTKSVTDTDATGESRFYRVRAMVP